MNFDLKLIQENYPYELLLLADPSQVQIEHYLFEGNCYIAVVGEEVIAVLVLQQISKNTVEIKNIAVSKSYQKKGIGKQLLQQATKITQDAGFEILRVATGNSSMNQLAFYQKSGFEMLQIQRNYFIENYDFPIVEDGIPCKHQVILEKSLLKSS